MCTIIVPLGAHITEVLSLDLGLHLLRPLERKIFTVALFFIEYGNDFASVSSARLLASMSTIISFACVYYWSDSKYS